MKNNKLFTGNIIKSCHICFFGRPSYNGTCVFCRKNGVMHPGDICKGFKYDPLKRTPKKIEMASDYKPEDFRL